MSAAWRSYAVVSALATGVAIVVACGGGGGTTATCSSGETRACVGAGGCAGGQSCSGGAWSSCDCGGAEAGVDAEATDGSSDGTADGGADITPYLKNCPQIAGTAPMVEVPAQGGGSFCIDTREVTAAEFKKYENGGVKDYPANCPGFTSSSCLGKTPNETPNAGDLPANCLGWCMAYSFCSVAGKRLCSRTEFRRACEGTMGDLPWGGNFAAVAAQCFGLSPAPKAGATNCHTNEIPYGFANELANGVIEWTNDTQPPIANTQGQRSGGTTDGSYSQGAPVCEAITENMKVATASDYPGFTNTGFRCCAMAK